MSSSFPLVSISVSPSQLQLPIPPTSSLPQPQSMADTASLLLLAAGNQESPLPLSSSNFSINILESTDVTNDVGSSALPIIAANGSSSSSSSAAGAPKRAKFTETIVVQKVQEFEFNGSWVGGKPHGEGVASYTDGSRFAGIFFEGKKDGFGLLTDTKGRHFIEEWNKGSLVKIGEYSGELSEDGFAHGLGKVVDEHGFRYEGNFERNYFNDFGATTNTFGNRYVGYHLKGQRQGKGIFTLAKELASYNGEFDKGFANGQGTLTVKDGRKFSGIWKKNWLIAESGDLITFDGRYGGPQQNGIPHGRGPYTNWNGGACECEFNEGVFDKNKPVYSITPYSSRQCLPMQLPRSNDFDQIPLLEPAILVPPIPPTSTRPAIDTDEKMKDVAPISSSSSNPIKKENKEQPKPGLKRKETDVKAEEAVDGGAIVKTEVKIKLEPQSKSSEIRPFQK